MVATSTAHIPTAGTIHNIAQCLPSPLSHRRLIPLKCDSLNLNIMVMRARAGGGVHLCHANHRLQSHSSAPHCGHPDHGDSDTRGDTVCRLTGGRAIVLLQQRFLSIIPKPGGKSVKVETKWRKSEQILNPPIKDQKRHW